TRWPVVSSRTATQTAPKPSAAISFATTAEMSSRLDIAARRVVMLASRLNEGSGCFSVIVMRRRLYRDRGGPEQVIGVAGRRWRPGATSARQMTRSAWGEVDLRVGAGRT